MPVFHLCESHILNFLKGIFDSHILSALPIKGLPQMRSSRVKEYILREAAASWDIF